MFGLGMLEVAIVAAVALAMEMVLFWASVALADGPEVKLPKIALMALLVVAACGPLIFLCFRLFGAQDQPLQVVPIWKSWAAGGLSLLVLLAVPLLLNIPLVPVSIRKGLWVAILQWLLRIFLTSLIVAFVLVVLAVLQILRSNKTASLPSAPPPLHASLTVPLP
jgi:hypothetical protein